MSFLPVAVVWQHSHLFLIAFSSLCLFYAFFSSQKIYADWPTAGCGHLTMLFFIKLWLLVTISNFSSAIHDLMPFNFLCRLSLLENLRKQRGLTEFLLLIL